MTIYHIYESPIGGKSVRRTDPDGKVWFIPFSDNNTDYQAYLAWVAEGNTAEEWSADAD